jgi:hypothetical protein
LADPNVANLSPGTYDIQASDLGVDELQGYTSGPVFDLS